MILATIFSCQKDISLSDNNHPNLNFRSTTSIPEFDHGAQIRGIIDSLKTVEATTDIDELYEAIGIDLKDTSLRNVTLYPAALKYEIDHGYSSTRNVEEMVIIDSLNQGYDPINQNVNRPYFNTLLNVNRTMILDHRYLVFFNDTEVTMIPKYDQITYGSINESKDFKNGYNVRIENTEYLPLDKWYEVDNDSLPTFSKPIFDISIYAEFNSNGTLTIWNNSYLEYADHTEPIFEWHYKDGSTSQGPLPNKPINVNKFLSVSIGNSTNDPIEVEVETRAIDCTGSQFYIKRLNGQNFRFEKLGGTECNPIGQGGYRYHYRFENGQTSPECQPNFTHTFSNNLIGTSAEICLVYTKNSGGPGQGKPVCSRCYNIYIYPNCAEKDKTDGQNEFNIGNETYRLRVDNEINDQLFITSGKIEGRSRTRIRKWWGWQQKRVDELCVRLTGRYYMEEDILGDMGCGQRVIADETWFCRNNVLSHTLEDPTNYADGREKKYPGLFQTQHKFTVDNEENIYVNPSGDPFLILQ